MTLLPLHGKFIQKVATGIAGSAVLFASLITANCGGSSPSSSPASTPSITSQPQSQTVTAPAQATFTVTATGLAPLGYQWKKNGNVIAGATSATYTTPATTASDNGAVFVAVVTDSAGSATSAPAVLTVNSASGSGSFSLSATGGDGQSAVILTPFASVLQVTVKDASGNPAPNESVTFAAPPNAASASFANGGQSMTATTDANGMAKSTTLTANGTVGTYAVTATLSGSLASTTFNLSNVSSSGSGIPQFSHVFIVVEENHSFSDVIGNANMPYLNGLASANGLATQYYADAHPSLPNYFELTVGEGTSITGTSGDSYNGTVTQDNVVRALVAAGKTWKSYAESLPTTGYLGGDSGAYVKRHNPVVYFSDVQQSSTQANNVVPFTQLASDIASNSLPDYGFIAPNVNDDAHDCPVGMSTCTDTQKLAAADQWLSNNIQPLLSSAAFKDSLLIIVFDEAEDSDVTYGGGHVAAILVSPLVKPGYQSTTLYQHESLLRLSMEALGASDLPGSAATAPDMTEFFQ